MRITVLGATGGTGRHLVAQALGRGHQVDVIVRDPASAALPASPRLTIHRGDVHDPASIAAAISPGSAVVSGLGVSGKSQAGTLTAGARAVVAAQPARIVWLGAIGTGRSADAVGRLTAHPAPLSRGSSSTSPRIPRIPVRSSSPTRNKRLPRRDTGETAGRRL